ncbi:hypothetical protein AAFF_G00371910 [Aldrovandia affinis]|uniref:Uncharacterized protein n=1 Tax=Aldrovandia affinis TaxID=143900 RepID=A0AAD7VYH7_9TELE|nr:hypothetical protein AAFF_G00371910 [Aldrovandia affinis]
MPQSYWLSARYRCVQLTGQGGACDPASCLLHREHGFGAQRLARDTRDTRGDGITMEMGKDRDTVGFSRLSRVQSIRRLSGMLQRAAPALPQVTSGSAGKNRAFRSPHSKDCESRAAEEYPVYENILLIGEEKCVEDWPEDSPELRPDWKPAGRLRLRRDSMKVQTAWGEEDLMENSGKAVQKGRRFTLPFTSLRGSKSGDGLSEKGADLFKGREGEEDDQDEMDDCRTQHKREKKFKLNFLQRRDSKSGDGLSEKGADLFKGREGEEDDQDEMDDCRTQHKRGKKFKLNFLQRRDSKSGDGLSEKGADLFKGREGEEDDQDEMDDCRTQLTGSPPGATCSNYDLSEAAEAEWLSAQRDEYQISGAMAEETGGQEEGDTDSLMEWWNTVEQWDELPSDDEDLTEEEEVKLRRASCVNKLFMEQAEALWQHVIDLRAIAENLHEFHKKAKIASVTGGTTSAVGGVTAIAGLALAPVTLGVSPSSRRANISQDRKKVERIVEDYQAKMADISKCLGYVRLGMERVQTRSALQTSRGRRQDHASAGLHMASEAGDTADRAVQITVRAGSELASLAQGMDSYMGKSPRELKKDCKMEFVIKIREVAEHLHEGLVELNTIREDLQSAIYA